MSPERSQMKRLSGLLFSATLVSAMGGVACVNILGDGFEKVGHELHEGNGGEGDEGATGPGPSGTGGATSASSVSASSTSAASTGEASASSASSVAASSAAATTAASSVAASSVAASSVAASSSSTGGNPTCDDQPTCTSCQDCAFAGACSDELDDCALSADCTALVDCLSPCTTTACDNACFNAHPTGAAIYDILAVCVICDECPITCDGAGAGC